MSESMPNHGIKETKELIEAMNEVALVLISQFKDGVQSSDFADLFTKIYSDQAFRDKIQYGWENYKKIPDEVKDLDINEAVELAMVQLNYLPQLIGSLK